MRLKMFIGEQKTTNPAGGGLEKGGNSLFGVFFKIIKNQFFVAWGQMIVVFDHFNYLLFNASRQFTCFVCSVNLLRLKRNRCGGIDVRIVR